MENSEKYFFIFSFITYTLSMLFYIAYAAFALAFVAGVICLIRERQLKLKKEPELLSSLPSLELLDEIISRLIGWGFPILTLAIILGAWWAYNARGRYWSWDPKETWTLITWITYAIYLHMRTVMSWRGRKTVILAVMGFGVVIFTYVGVNSLFFLHGFLSGQGQ